MGSACARHVISGRRTARRSRADMRKCVRGKQADPVWGWVAQTPNELNQKFPAWGTAAGNGKGVGVGLTDCSFSRHVHRLL